MKRQPVVGNKISIIHIVDKRLVFKIYKEFPKSVRKCRPPNKKWATMWTGTSEKRISKLQIYSINSAQTL